MRYYKATIQYIGTNYSGFQYQSNALTIQQELNQVISKVATGKFSTTAASRTDKGVHAIEQIVKITTEHPLELKNIKNAMMKLLSSQIKIIHIENCEGSFKPNSMAHSKEYRYFFTNERQSLKDDQQFIANISNILNIESMQFCAEALLGTHDFKNFYSQGSNVLSTCRKVLISELTIVKPQDIFKEQTIFTIPKELISCFQFKIEASGFLKQMIRHLVSALWMVGSGKISKEEFLYLLDGPKKNKQLWKVASPNGLFLFRIKY